MPIPWWKYCSITAHKLNFILPGFRNEPCSFLSLLSFWHPVSHRGQHVAPVGRGHLPPHAFLPEECRLCDNCDLHSSVKFTRLKYELPPALLFMQAARSGAVLLAEYELVRHIFVFDKDNCWTHLGRDLRRSAILLVCQSPWREMI